MDTKLVHKHFKMGSASKYTYKGMWCQPSQSFQQSYPNEYNLQMQSRPDSCQFSCDHCGTGIRNHCIIEDENGQEFVVGVDCIKKLHDVERLSKMEIDRKAHNNKLSKIRADKKREETRQQREQILEDQRANNNGLTDYELKQKIEKEKQASEQESNTVDCEYFTKALKEIGGNFGLSVSNDMINYRSIPKGRGLTIMLDITAKYYSKSKRSGTKAYNAIYPEIEDKIEALKEKWK